MQFYESKIKIKQKIRKFKKQDKRYFFVCVNKLMLIYYLERIFTISAELYTKFCPKEFFPTSSSTEKWSQS